MEDNIFIIPVADDIGNFSGSEYLGLYQVVEFSDKFVLASFKPGESTGLNLESILQNKGIIYG